eukprot:TRINITY_DN37224_c0_g1_i1.p1 TRINITY_DN37224_c0_g1~~TRINITY_DN37224_c0_g1_i1.p1  ORF type:complete len:496 (+),score=63.04 TRINITY_DN37224_c0_g1_i1:113-1600(+)
MQVLPTPARKGMALRPEVSVASLSLVGCRIFLCPLGGLSKVRRKVLERRIIDCGGQVCSGTTAVELSAATHCVVDTKLPQVRFEREEYSLPANCKCVTEAWLSGSLDAGESLSEQPFEAWTEDAENDEQSSRRSTVSCFSSISIPVVGSTTGSLRETHMPSTGSHGLIGQRQKERKLEDACTDGIVAIDCEFVGVGKNTAGIGGDRNALARISVVAPGGKVLMDTTVQVLEPVVDFRIHITGLTQAAVDNGVHPDVARSWVAYFLTGRIVVGHSLSHDWKVLGLSHPPHLVRDTARWQPLRPAGFETKVASLQELARVWLGKTIQAGLHDSIEDASTALDLYILRKDEWDADVAKQGTSGLMAADLERRCRPSEDAPFGAAALVAATAAAAAALKDGRGLKRSRSGLNLRMADEFERRAARPGAAKHAALHYRRVARTLTALPYALETVHDLDRPELVCLGKPGSHSRRLAVKLLQTTPPQDADSPEVLSCSSDD